ncbi:unnamed protein product [Angiostrongylus costaricensis]|uniref:Ig-like domain-containing protein n=1 Tax=Angiostrongylus costaricensis TaxID=334426 RepID=A0A158PKT3_ANGCS|nr:unnamed protein product [Angiostrongylus costaricensis]
MDGVYMECTKDANGSPVLKVLKNPEEVKCKDGEGKERSQGAEWKDGSFKFKCSADGEVLLIGCFTSSGKLVSNGEVKSVDGVDMECKTNPDGNPVLKVLKKSNKVKCKDAGGQERDSGAEWNDGSFQFKCDERGEVKFVGCFTPSGELIPKGETKSVDGEDMQCKTDPEGKPMLETIEEPNQIKCKEAGGQERDSGAEWNDGFFQFKCDERGEVKFVGCFTPSGELIPKGETKSVDGEDMQCKTDPEGKPMLETIEEPNQIKCKEAGGQERDSGAEWEDGSFQFKCDENGEVALVGCFSSSGVLVPNGERKWVDEGGVECKTDPDGNPVLEILEKTNKVKCKLGGGTEEDPGTEWSVGWFQFKCTENGTVVLSGCFTSKGMLVPYGEVREERGSYVECKKDANGSPVLEVLETLSEMKCKDNSGTVKDLGSEWTVGWFQFKCTEGGKVEFMGCFISTGKLIPNGERATDAGRDLECKIDGRGFPFLEVLGKSSDTKCKDDEGKYRMKGEEWVEKNFQKVCREHGRVEVLGCRVEDIDDLIPLNGKVSAEKYDH